MTKRFGGRSAPVTIKTRLTVQEHEILTRAPLAQAFDQMRPGDMREQGPWLGSAYHSRAPLPVKTQLAFGQRDYTGVRIDRLTVIGAVDEAKRKFGPRWLVRCDCGIYETRQVSALRGRMRGDVARCQRCGYLLKIQRQAHFDRTGRWPTEAPEPLGDLQVPVNLTRPTPAPNPDDRGHKGKGDRTAQRRRARQRKRQSQRCEADHA